MAGFDVVPRDRPRSKVAGTRQLLHLKQMYPNSRSRGMVPLVISKLASAPHLAEVQERGRDEPLTAAPGPTPQGDGQSPKLDKSAYAGGSQHTHRA